MPPKKKKGGKKSGKKKSAQKSATPTSLKITDVFNEVSKEFYVVQIRDLEQKIARYQEKCDLLEIRNKEVENEHDQQASDKKEIVSFLKKQLEQRSDEITDLQDRLISIQQSKDVEKDKYELEIATLKTEMQETKDQLTSENMVLGGKLASLEEFRIQKEDLLNKFAEMEELLNTQEQNHKEQIYQLERKAVVDKDRLKKEMILRVNTVAAEFRKVSNKQMAETTKRTIRENVMINAQLSKMSEKTMELIAENDDARQKEKKQRQHIEILEDNEKELVKKNTTNQKVMRMLTAKAHEQQEIIEEMAEKEANFVKTEMEMTRMREELNELKQTQTEMVTERRRMHEECEIHRKDIARLDENKEYLINILSDATSVIKQALQHNDDNKDSAITEMKNTNLLYKVIEILNLAVEMGVGMNPEDLATRKKVKKHSKVNLGPPIISKSVGGIPRSGLHSSSKPLAHYKLGDLGLVPAGKSGKKHDKNIGIVSSGSSRRGTGSSKNKEKATFYTDEQLAKGTPRGSTYDLVKGGMVKLPVLSSIS